MGAPKVRPDTRTDGQEVIHRIAGFRTGGTGMGAW